MDGDGNGGDSFSNGMSFRGWCALFFCIYRDTMNRSMMDDFFGGIYDDQPTKPIHSNTKPNQPIQTIPPQPDIPNQPTTSIHHFPPPSSTPPTPPPLFQGLRSAAHGCLEEFGEMDVVEFASAEVGRGGCGCCGFSGGLKPVGWMVLFIKPLL